MKLSKRVTVGLVGMGVLCVAATAWAAAWTTGGDGGFYTIKEIISDTPGYTVYLDPPLTLADRGNDSSCPSNPVRMSTAAYNVTESNKTLLAAFLANKKVALTLLAGCNNSTGKTYTLVSVHKDK
jgi:hypothetical protein